METILVVDDESTILNLCQKILERGGYAVLRASNGGEALRLVQNNSLIHLAILDVVMPEMNGVELAHQLHNATPTTKVVLMSGYGPEEITNVVGPKNSYRIIWKPLASESLLHMIKNVLDPTTLPHGSGVGLVPGAFQTPAEKRHPGKRRKT